MRLRLVVISSRGDLLEEEVDALYVDTSEGPVGILPGHDLYMAALKKEGTFSLERRGSRRKFLYQGGLLNVRRDKTFLLVNAFRPEAE